MKQQLEYLARVTPRRVMYTMLDVVVNIMNTCSPPRQKFESLSRVTLASVEKRRFSGEVPRIKIHSIGQQKLYNINAVIQAGLHQWCFTSSVLLTEESLNIDATAPIL